MLTDQTFSHPITIGVGHEIFHDPESPTGYNLPLIAIFKRDVLGMGNFIFQFIDVLEPKGIDEIFVFVAGLEGFGISFAHIFLFDVRVPQHIVDLNGIVNTLDISNAPELLDRAPVVYRDGISDLPAAGFVECLRTLAGSTTPFSRPLFRQLETEWAMKNR